MSSLEHLDACQRTEASRLDAIRESVYGVRSDFRRDPSRYLGKPWSLFIREVILLPPQSYGVHLQNYLAHFYGWRTVPASEDRGDIVDEAGEYHEVKVTCLMPWSRTANFVQIRPHQVISGYHLFVVDLELELAHFWLSKEDMADELAVRGSSAHGTSSANAKNTNREFALRFPWSDEGDVLRRWRERYAAPGPVPD